jgi:hypothetical protein
MKQLNISILILYFSITICFGQSNPTQQNLIEQKTPGKCSNKIENKSICLCNYFSDTISYSQLASCRELTLNKKLSIDGKSNNTIVSYSLMVPNEEDNSLFEFQGSNTILTDEMVNKIIEIKAKKIIFTEVLSWDGSTHDYLGHRTYYLKK